MKHTIYLDNHATTRMDPRVLEYMMPYLTEKFGNPSSLDHSLGHEAFVAIDEARGRVADLVGACHDEIVFTSGATEADNMALMGVMARHHKRGKHLVTCTIEHKAILDTARHLQRLGYSVTYVPVDRFGSVDMEQLREAITSDTVLISIMTANNEIGTIQNVSEVGKLAHKHDILFHTDGAQAVGHIPVDVQKMNIDLMSMSAHKMYGPKGVGALYIRSIRPIVRLDGIIRGGGQEWGLRSGTHNVAGIVGFGEAARLAQSQMKLEGEQQRTWTGMMLERFQKFGATLNGHPTNRLPHNLNVRFSGIEGKAIINSVSDKVAISAGSACTTQMVEPSHVLLAIGLAEDKAHESIRLGLGRFTTNTEVDDSTCTILEAVEDLKRSTA